MNRRQKIIVSVTGIFLVLLLLVGLTYGYFLTKISGNTNTKSISVSTANLALVYGNDNGSIIGDGELIVPGKIFEPKTFTVTNNGNATTEYVVVIENVTSTFTNNDFTYTLTCKSGCNEVSTKTTFPISGGVLVGNSIEVGETQSYSFTLTYEETGTDQSVDMNKTLNAKINIKDISGENPYSSNTSLLSYNIINNAITAKNGTTLTNLPLTTPAKGSGNIVYTGYTDPTSFSTTTSYTSKWYVYGNKVTMDKNGYFKITDPQVGQFSSVATSMRNGYVSLFYGHDDEATATKYMNDEFPTVYKVGSETTTSTLYYKEVTKTSENTESVLSVTTDDYGTSYYYRGGVEDNYVNFAGMCWRIVRIEGDGSTKLILEDQSTTCDSSTFTGNWSDGNTYVYGNDGNYKKNYLNYSGGLADAFKTFQTSKLSSVLDKLKVDEWCYDDTVTNTYSWGYDANYNEVYNQSEATKGWYTYEIYGAYTRISDKKPSLNCTGTKLTKYKDGTDMYVSTLTADEVSFAGATSSVNYAYYLMNDYAQNNYLSWWLLSPNRYGDGYTGDAAFKLLYDGRLVDGCVRDQDYPSRPAVTLKSSTVITSGDGSISNPYTIK